MEGLVKLSSKYFIHPTAIVSQEAKIGSRTFIWHFTHIREGAMVGKECIIGQGVYIDFNVKVGGRVKIQNGAYIYHGSTIEDGVFIGPGVILTNDKNPRAVTASGSIKKELDWKSGTIIVRRGASLGAGVVVLPNIEIGKFALVGAGSIVTKNVPDFGLVTGNPSLLRGFVCECGYRLEQNSNKGQKIITKCSNCKKTKGIPLSKWKMIS